MSHWVRCSEAECVELHQGPGRCPDCRRAADKRRGTTRDRGYSTRGHRRFRREVLTRDPICVLCHLAVATVADHWPVSRRELEARGSNPDEPNAGRGLCKSCHDSETARLQPGGWANRSSF